MTPKLLIKRKGDAPEAAPLIDVPLNGALVSLGSDAAATVSLRGANVAPEQAVIVREDGQLLLINRADGTTLNDELLAREARRPLAHGDRLGIGDYVAFLVTDETSAGSEDETSVNADLDGRLRACAEATTTDLTPNARAATDAAQIRPPQPQQQQPNGNERTAPRNFAAILDTLRTEEDSFYLLVEGGMDSGRRVRLEALETLLGWEETGQRLAFTDDEVVARRAVLRKDWTGVVVQSLGVGLVAVNGEPVEATRQLRNGDRLTLVPTVNTAAQNQAILIFHEPASLLALDSLLPQKLPPPVALQPVAPDTGLVAQGESATAAPELARPRDARHAATARTYFGYFTRGEVLLMIVATLVTAAIIFLVLEFTA
ncbi:MAG TPA: FHA domain-containing protein [Pyrinomonadaceae bacterium]|jgi:pSer/pThr/pTyr-binding forkhead associated (FHA) protein